MTAADRTSEFVNSDCALAKKGLAFPSKHSMYVDVRGPTVTGGHPSPRRSHRSGARSGEGPDRPCSREARQPPRLRWYLAIETGVPYPADPHDLGALPITSAGRFSPLGLLRLVQSFQLIAGQSPSFIIFHNYGLKSSSLKLKALFQGACCRIPLKRDDVHIIVGGGNREGHLAEPLAKRLTN